MENFRKEHIAYTGPSYKKGIAKRNTSRSRVFYFLFEFEVDRNVVVTSKIATAVKLLKKRKSIKPGCSIHG